MGEIVVLEPGEGAGVIGGAVDMGAGILDRGKRVFPGRPGLGEHRLFGRIARKKALVIGGDHVAALGFGDDLGEPLPQLGPELPGAAAIEPVKLVAGHQEHAPEHQPGDTVRVGLGIDEPQRRAP